MSETSIKAVARKTAKDAIGDLGVVNKVKGCLVIIKSEYVRAIDDQEWRGQIMARLAPVLKGWKLIKQVDGLMIFKLE